MNRCKIFATVLWWYMFTPKLTVRWDLETMQ